MTEIIKYLALEISKTAIIDFTKKIVLDPEEAIVLRDSIIDSVEQHLKGLEISGEM